MFKFIDYTFDHQTATATFRYAFENTDLAFTERVEFAKTDYVVDQELLDRALFLCFILIGISYYKTHPTRKVDLGKYRIDELQAKFFDAVYQEGLSQLAYENHLTRNDLAYFIPNSPDEADPLNLNPSDYEGILSLQSGGKDSLLVATILRQKNIPFTPWYCASSDFHPAIIDQLTDQPAIITKRFIDHRNREKAGGLNGHIPITYINSALAIVQAILSHKTTILTAIGREGNEPHAEIGDLKVNHQWSKTWPAEQALAAYVHRCISPDLNIGSPIRGFSELKIAELFVKNCWPTYGPNFSSCNVANYHQGQNNHNLTWCGKCAKCANSYLLFAPFIERAELDSLFQGRCLFEEPSLVDDFKGLLGVDHHIKPFECVGEIAELRAAYAMKRPEYPNLPFEVPASDFDYERISSAQKFTEELYE